MTASWQLEPGGIAHRDGRLLDGDTILSINDKEVHVTYTHANARAHARAQAHEHAHAHAHA